MTRPTLVDVFTPHTVRAWFRFVLVDGCAFHPIACGNDRIGMPPEWWEGIDITEVIRVDEYGSAAPVFEYKSVEIRTAWMQWAMEHGIAIGQPFLLEVDSPRYYQTSYEYEEYDVDWQFALLEVRPISTAAAIKRWEACMRKLYKWAAIDHECNQRYLDLARKDTGSMYVQRTTYLSGYGWGSTGEDRVSEAIYSSHHRSPSFGHGSSSKGDAEAARQALIESACAANVYLSPEVIEDMPVRIY